MSNVVALNPETITVLLCVICESSEWHLLEDGKVLCSNCGVDLDYRWWDAEGPDAA